MADNTPGGQPPAPAAIIPAAAPAVQPSSLPNPETAATERAGKANSPQAIRSLLSDLRKAPAIKPAEGKPAEAPPAPAADPAEAPAAAPADAPAVDTPAPDTDPAADPETSDAPEDEGGGGEGPITPITGKRAHLRLPPESDKVGRLALSILKRNQDLTLEEATTRAKGQLGIKTEAPAPAAAPDPSKPQLPTTIDAVDAELERLTSEEDKATIELRFEDAIKSRKSQRDLTKHRATIEREGQRQQSQQAQEYRTAFERSEDRSIELYEFAGNPESEGGKRMLEIEAALKENGDPLHESPDKPLRIAQMVAAELKIAPKRKGQPAAVVKPTAPAAPAQKKQVLPGGGSSTTPPASNPSTAVAEQFGKITTVHQLRQALKPLTGRR